MKKNKNLFAMVLLIRLKRTKNTNTHTRTTDGKMRPLKSTAQHRMKFLASSKNQST